AYAIAGPVGVGKRALATVFAQALLCPTERPDRSVPCGVCRACRNVVRGAHPDVQVFDLAGQAAEAEKRGTKNTTLTIDTVRRLRAGAALRPMEAARRIIIVDDAETMQEPAQEALLKTLEEPPQAVTLLLLTDDAEALLPTIRSRCQTIELRPVGVGAITAGLEASGAAPDRAREIALLAQGRPGWAIHAARDEKMLRAHAERVEHALAWVEGSPYDRLVRAVQRGDAFSKQRDLVFADVETVLGIWRDLLLMSGGAPGAITYQREQGRLERLAAGWDLAGVCRAVTSVQRCLADLEANVRPRLALEGMVAEWPNPTARN
ncbi:MAG: AAA family ATPase, partial [Thermomicrobiales bacterium]|nr:AAA family ATPase [Thermomicrobiales bacterium]